MAWYRCSGGGGAPVSTFKIVADIGINGMSISDNRYLHCASVYTEAYYPKKVNGDTPVLNMANAWKMHYKFKCSALVNKEQAVYGARETFYRLPNCEMQSSSNTSFLWAGWSTNGTSSDGNPFTVTKNEMPFVANQWYTIEETWDGNGTATFKVSDGTNTVTKTATKSAFATVADTSPALGRVGNADHPSTNITFDLYDCYWEQDGVILWGNKAE